MGILFQVTDAHKSYGDQILLDGADATISDNTKVGFIGRNGAGKSTLLRVLLGEEELDSGEVVRSPNLRLGYLRQHDPFLPGETALEYLMRDSEQPDWKCGEVAGQFELKGAYLNGPVAKLSGGWQTRLKLAALLLHEPNLLMLDEPTNFLDLRTQILLEHFLRDFRAACLIVSHDRAFLSATCDHTIGLSRGKLTSFPGKVDAFLEFQRENRERAERSNEAILAKRRHLEDFIARNKARAATAGLAQSKAKALEKLETVEVLGDEPTPHIRAPQIEPRKGVAVRCRDLAIGYPDRQIASDVQLEIDHGTRVAIVGDNGQGKTTFLRTLVDSLKPVAGDVRWGHGCKLGVYAQHVYTTLPERDTVLEYLQQKGKGRKIQEILEVAGALLFRGSHVDKPISVLSGGERARVCLAGLLLSDYNVLVLDEPGNHLDVDTVEALMDALLEYEGTVVFTSHDRHFTKRIATSVIEVRDGRVLLYNGKYDDYVYRVNKEIEAGERELAAGKVKLPDEVTKAPKVAPRVTRDETQVRKEMKALEGTIATLDEKRRALETQLNEPAEADELQRMCDELADIATELDTAEQTWLKLQSELEAK
ncbi:abc transporter atp-binding protein : ABC transporter related protein OS=Planctomyces limnophilus (strain ATCC 43296 / DSM 3776 / IFAM 1008 / 290) GN=Plim_1648 PE=3 SV=1: ABC_tran: ABC_tran_2: ABC_tran [Gemmata massiliana]|uniref:ABC transporter domain-containing protein n=1 Tax=Gemmata massiliana TaxID=1210884 RepID=A0A6P2D8U6_9BACT|nr:ABC-F family ATP-binding cassette domain-containing protein [Gemmata massiliana]VTR96795.1 abc transporter atp-binding protein : ABC transporter related protein OS=Planctomyces limnophilus (strain ATCC 43296 / DSM 3776 / IFAM 1008 / 290) GN=Plim_1648 PE=3 SV=1: ABC_tran: ABC_tran_2: ABC_tran [Gemmata massiliana]